MKANSLLDALVTGGVYNLYLSIYYVLLLLFYYAWITFFLKAWSSPWTWDGFTGSYDPSGLWWPLVSWRCTRSTSERESETMQLGSQRGGRGPGGPARGPPGPECWEERGCRVVKRVFWTRTASTPFSFKTRFHLVIRLLCVYISERGVFIWNWWDFFFFFFVGSKGFSVAALVSWQLQCLPKAFSGYKITSIEHHVFCSHTHTHTVSRGCPCASRSAMNCVWRLPRCQ